MHFNKKIFCGLLGINQGRCYCFPNNRVHKAVILGGMMGAIRTERCSASSSHSFGDQTKRVKTDKIRSERWNTIGNKQSL